MKRVLVLIVLMLLGTQPALAARAKIETISKDPYVSAMAVDGHSGDVLIDENIDAITYPASVLKLMVLLVVLERIEQGSLKLDEMVQVTKEAAQMGGSQVYLDPKEQFSVEDLLYALTIQSANDAAVALAVHVAGSKDGFVELMNQKAAELGMNTTTFYSVHGLPPSEGQKPDQTSARDLATLALALTRNPEVFKYTGTTERDFRGGEFIMRTHNKLLASVDGCDGFKTGYFKAAGFSIVATAQRNGVRIIAIVLGSVDRRTRDAKASELLARGFAKVPAKPQPQTASAPAGSVGQPAGEAAVQTEDMGQKPVADANKAPSTTSLARDLTMLSIGFGAGLLAWVMVGLLRSRPRHKRRRLM